MTTLTGTNLLTYENGQTEIYAVWQDELGTFSAIHRLDGTVSVKAEGTNPPRLTHSQVKAAMVPPLHPAYALAAKGKAAKPAWGSRYEKAAALVESGAVRLTGQETAVVKGDSGEYQLSSKECTCRWGQYHTSDDPCSHYIAVRMARALNQAIESPVTEIVEVKTAAEKEAEARDRVEAEKAAVAQRVSDGRYKMDQQWKQARRDGDGARRWMLSHMAHNGYTSVPTDIYRRAAGVGREEELARLKEEILAGQAAKYAAIMGGNNV